MPFASQGFLLSVTLVDTGIDPTVKTYQLRAATYAVAQAAADDMIPIIEAASNSKVASYEIRNPYAATGFIPPSVAGARNSMQAIITVAIADAPLKHADLVIPAPVAAVFQTADGPGSDIVDVNATVVSDYINMFKAAGQAYISDGETVADASQARGVRRTVYRRLARN